MSMFMSSSSSSKILVLQSIRSIFFFFLLSCLLTSAAQRHDSITHPIEVTALHAVRRRLKDPLNHLRSWKNKGDPCSSNWTGLVCYNTTLPDGYLHLKELQLNNMNLFGRLSPQLGHFSYLTILDCMWNNITGDIPKEIANISSLQLLILNGNNLSGSLPAELGFLPNLNRIQIDQNQISGPIPKSFANLIKTEHFHMNNNSISGQIPPELSRLPNLEHFLLDNNNLTGYLPPELSQMPSLTILQLDNNHFDGTSIPDSYANMTQLLKLSLRNCSLQGPIPDLSRIPNLYYVDLSRNQLNGSIPSDKLSDNITTIDISNNQLTGSIPLNFSGLSRLQKLSLANNSLSGSVSSSIWLNRTLNATESLILDFQNNSLSNVTGSADLPANVTLRLRGNPLCLDANLLQLCGFHNPDEDINQGSTNSTSGCSRCPVYFEHARGSPQICFCAAPLLVGYRLKSPGFFDFLPYRDPFEDYLTSGLDIYIYQLDIDSFIWQKGPRLNMYLKIFPVYDAGSNNSGIFNKSEARRIQSMFRQWGFPDSDIFGPYELLNFTLLPPYIYDDVSPSSPGISKGALAGIILGVIAGAATLSALFSILILKRHQRKRQAPARRRELLRISKNINSIRDFTFEEITSATNNFNRSSQVGQGGYGKVYKGILADGTIVAVKRAEERSLKGENEFLTEIELLSRCHHRNLVSLIGYCDEEGEQMLVYEFMPNGTLREQISEKSKTSLNFMARLRIALGSSKGILYLHREADPPIFHRDIKASNILLDSKFIAKVADFGLSRLAPIPDFEGTIPTHVSTNVKGTPGYVDPEYFLTQKLTDKSDVYSLGVVFLELLTGMHPVMHGKNIVREVKVAYRSGLIHSVIDERMGSYPAACVERFATLALKCCQDETDARPSMDEVVRELESILRLIPESETSGSSRDTSSSRFNNYGNRTMKNPYALLSKFSGGDLASGVTFSIAPR